MERRTVIRTGGECILFVEKIGVAVFYVDMKKET